MLAVAQNDMLIRPMIYLFDENGHSSRILTSLFYMYQSVGFEFDNTSFSSKKKNTYTHQRKYPHIMADMAVFQKLTKRQKLKAILTKLDILEHMTGI